MTPSSQADFVKIGVASICLAYIVKNLIRDVFEYQQRQQRNASSSSKNDAPDSLNSTFTDTYMRNRSVVDRETTTEDSSNSSIVDDGSSAQQQQFRQQRRCEVLVHNIAHTDLILSMESPSVVQSDGDVLLCRPRFSAFSSFSKRVFDVLSRKTTKKGLAQFPVYDRKENQVKLSTPRTLRYIPVGFKDFGSIPMTEEDVHNVRIRGGDAKILGHETKGLKISAVLFPLLSFLVPKWLHSLEENGCNEDTKKVIILVSGVGTPRNYSHEIKGNSTEYCSKLMEMFIKYLYPDITVVRVHSQSCNIFRYDENISFVKSHLLPKIQGYRDSLTRNRPYPDDVNYLESEIEDRNNYFDPDLANFFRVSISFADGSPARTHAIQSCLRSFRPTYFHIWALKTLWHDGKVCYDDVEMFSFSEIDTSPAVDVNLLKRSERESNDIRLIVEEMLKFKIEYLESALNPRSDIKKFWLRKSQKPVLSVLLVQTDNGNMKLYRGTNMEVSMPTGSLCAERNVIGTALASNPGLRREDIRMVSVLALPLPSYTDERFGSLAKFRDTVQKQLSAAQNDLHSNNLALFDRSKIRRSVSVGSFHSIVEEKSAEKSPLHSGIVFEDDLARKMLPPEIGNFTLLPSTEMKDNESFDTNYKKDESQPGTPKRRIRLYDQFEQSNPTCISHERLRKRSVLLHTSAGDLNPLKPCGACNEWLKKIAECNPYFKVITFTDADCNGVYCQSCQD